MKQHQQQAGIIVNDGQKSWSFSSTFAANPGRLWLDLFCRLLFRQLLFLGHLCV